MIVALADKIVGVPTLYDISLPCCGASLVERLRLLHMPDFSLLVQSNSSPSSLCSTLRFASSAPPEEPESIRGKVSYKKSSLNIGSTGFPLPAFQFTATGLGEIVTYCHGHAAC